MAERVEEARKFGEYVAEQMEGIGFRIEYTMNGKRKSPVYTGQRSTTYPDVQIEQRDRRVKGKRETVMSIDDLHSLLRSINRMHTEKVDVRQHKKSKLPMRKW